MNEVDLILACMKDPVDETAIRSIINSKLDWDRFIDIVAQHSLVSVVSNRLQEFPIPATVRNTLREYLFESIAKNLFLFDQLKHVAGVFERSGIDYILLKGFMLDEDLYKPRGLVRQFCDIDILVNKNRIELMKSLLRDDGFRFAATKIHRFYERIYRYHYPFKKDINDRTLSLEVHTSLYPVYSPFNVNVRELFRDSVIKDVNGLSIRGLCTEDGFIYLCAHFAYIHALSLKLRYLFEIAEMVNADVNWDRIIVLAAKQRTSFAVYYALHLTAKMINRNVPSQYLSKLRTECSESELFLISELERDRLLSDLTGEAPNDKLWLFRLLPVHPFRRRWLALLDYCVTKIRSNG